jgi:hypothetical protein
LDSRIKQLWVEALRSYDFEQTTHHLRGERNRRCCLGVLCDLAQTEGVGEWKGPRRFVAAGESANLIPPTPVFHWAGMEGYALPVPPSALMADLTPEERDRVTWSIGDDKQTYLDRLNDSGVSFHTISKLIEKYL